MKFCHCNFTLFYSLLSFLFLIHIPCQETLSVSFKVLEGKEDGKWSSELVYLDLIDVKVSIRKEKDEGEKGKDADDLFYVIGMEMKQPLEMVIQGFLRFESRNSTFVNELKASNGFQLQSNGFFERMTQDDGFRLKIHSQLKTRDHVQVTYDLECERRQVCPRILLNHSLTSVPRGFVTFHSEAVETCHTKSGENDHDSSNPSDLIIKILLQSHIFPLLNTQLDQIFVFDNDTTGWESMNATNPVADIGVKADWNETVHLKTASFTGKMFGLPSFDVEYHKDDGYSFLMKTKRIKLSNEHDEL